MYYDTIFIACMTMSREQIGQFLNDITLMTDTEQQDGDVVRLMTIHSSK